MITIAVDAMGGATRHAPRLEGSVLAVRELGVRVLLVGQPNRGPPGAGEACSAKSADRDRAR